MYNDSVFMVLPLYIVINLFADLKRTTESDVGATVTMSHAHMSHGGRPLLYGITAVLCVIVVKLYCSTSKTSPPF